MSNATGGSDIPVLLVEDAGRVRTLTFNRPDAKNAFNGALWLAATEALRDALRAPDVACVVLTGAGEAFCSGQDLREMEGAGAAVAVRAEAFVTALREFDKPLVAAVNGLAIGIGATMLGYCDIVLMADSARLRTPFVSLGLTTEAASSVTFVDRLGWQNAAHLLFTGAWMDAESAVAQGLAWRAVAADDVVAAANQVATTIAAMPINALRVTKQLMLADRRDRLVAASQRESEAFEGLLKSQAHAEALRAFREKRAPRFDGIDG